jgi:hypothetical protein
VTARLCFEPATVGQQAVPPGHHVYAFMRFLCDDQGFGRRWHRADDIPPAWRADAEVQRWRRDLVYFSGQGSTPQTVGTWMLDHERGSWFWKGYEPATCP